MAIFDHSRISLCALKLHPSASSSSADICNDFGVYAWRSVSACEKALQFSEGRRGPLNQRDVMAPGLPRCRIFVALLTPPRRSPMRGVGRSPWTERAHDCQSFDRKVGATI
jgi:hypothetical protein